MYDRVYAVMVDAKVATPMDESDYSFINRADRRIKTEEEASGNQIKHFLSHPLYVLFRDEVGTDTNQMEDSNNGGQIYISVNRMRVNLLS